MTVAATVTLLVVILVIATLIATPWPTDLVMVAGLTLLMVVPLPVADSSSGEPGWRIGVMPLRDALSGFSNEGMITVGALYLVVAGLRQTGAISLLAGPLLGRPSSVRMAQLRLMIPVAGASALLNNTPIVAMMLPVIVEWAKKYEMAASKLLIPLSFATILGGTCTLIGTSTNLIVDGLLRSDLGHPGLSLFAIAPVGIPVAIVGIVYLVWMGDWLLPDRRPAISKTDDPREYTAEMMVPSNSSLVGKTIESAGLRHLPGAYLMEIERNEQVIPVVDPSETLRAGDRLVFVGVVDSVVDLQKMRGLVPATDQVFKLDSPRVHRGLIEAVVSDSCPLVGRTIREGRFRTRYGAVVIAVARNGQRLKGKIGDIVLDAGDTLLLEALPNFADQQRNNRDFYLVSRVPGARPLRHERAPVAIGILAAMVVVVGLGIVEMLHAALVAGMLMILTRCCTTNMARREIEWSVLVAIAASFGIGRALEKTGAAESLVQTVFSFTADHPLAIMATVYLATTLLTNFVTNTAAAALMFPIAVAAAQNVNASPMPFVVSVMFAASAAFATPIGYQTNLMVYGPGGYRFSDFVRIGLPLNLLTAAVALVTIPWVFPFTERGLAINA
jgi:di/tricarboxylate transporter